MQHSKIVTKKPKVSFKNLNKHEVWGYADTDTNEVQLHDKLTQRLYIEIFLHEHLHCALPEASEKCVTDLAGMWADGLWRSGFRRTGKRKKKI